MKNSEVKLGMGVRVKHIAGPWMIIVAKTPGFLGSSMVSCMWFSREDVQQNGMFRAEHLESKDEYLTKLAEITSRNFAGFDSEEIEEERLKMQAEKRAEGDGTGFVKFGEAVQE
jgi:uncharacterized protein YodC (DUF2158 family)